ncbi:hypothetical protein [Psychromonas hadalis]|uniref:hypothetical protein n=1 Tax=Psychromonas hadalis TaxID=211669 RepID=UPI0003B685BD|nr:hypothetical protein [Psychromonas hadalis]
MPSILKAQCPCCNIVASGDLKKMDEFFGFRNMKDTGKKIAQSYCRNCRSKHCDPGHKKC